MSGQLRLFATLPYGYQHDVLEFTLPTLSSGAIPSSLNTATLVRRWYGDAGSGTGLYYGHAYYPDLTHPCRPHRDTDYTESYDDPPWNPTGGVGFWDWRAIYFQSLVWIETPTKYGLFFFSKQGAGRGWYDCLPGCAPKSERGADIAFVWDPNDMIAVIQGSAETWWPQPKSWWRLALPSGSQRYSDIKTATTDWNPTDWDYEPALWFDSTTNRLYISLFKPGVQPQGGGGGLSVCYVYQII